MRKYNRTIILKVQDKFFEDFEKTCEKEYKTKSEVLRDFMLKYIKEHKND
jgi:metal-responsive CopG/Arc/MetJ family transcriptional regulator